VPVDEFCRDEQGDGEGELGDAVDDAPVGVAPQLPEV
jgi:hypothetical protein